MSTEAEKLYEEQSKTYSGFLTLLKWSTIAIVVVLVLMYFFLVA
ncbi:aa3-type cytochrome c oxidase subunit IV [Maritalea porphyrae]|uniref:Cytochrome c oxidase subunit IV bacterial aa3 type domain-containing protein n=1 Tax=Maritalea porphyrae TaxID=880732 RepID=A0ABQ5UM06_9HYPH|nr:aa3-type cytochrome c oxidase subunit IV [Maritalea porphyrae]GLQ16301.1 hypothetical protein GCM10007879_05500 [Maritalea porphyrae]